MIYIDNRLGLIVYLCDTTGDTLLYDDKRVAKELYLGKEMHRSNGLPTIIHPNGCIEFYVKGRPHRSNNLPAYIHCTNIWKNEYWTDGILMTFIVEKAYW